MLARDVMNTDLVTTRPEMTVQEAAATMVDHHISALPVLDGAGRLVGIVSEGDLVQRAEIGTERRRSWWLDALVSEAEFRREFGKSHGRRVADVMSRRVYSVQRDTPLDEVARILEERGVKRVPVVDGDRLVGIVSRADILKALASGRLAPSATG